MSWKLENNSGMRFHLLPLILSFHDMSIKRAIPTENEYLNPDRSFSAGNTLQDIPCV